MTYRTPDWAEASKAFQEFCQTVAKLRHPKDGCPWDVKQDHLSLRRFMVEEAYEAFDAMTQGDGKALSDELGDVLLQVVLNAQVGIEQGSFDIVDVVRGINEKMQRRHPHVFTDPGRVSVDEVRANWEVIKEQERAGKPEGLFQGVVQKNPSTSQAAKIGKIAAKINFDWQTIGDVFKQVQSELLEVEEELAKPTVEKEKVAEEIGDLYFSLAQLCRHLDLDPETTALAANQKFLRRFAKLEELAKIAKIRVDEASNSELEKLWQQVKKLEKS